MSTFRPSPVKSNMPYYFSCLLRKICGHLPSEKVENIVGKFNLQFKADTSSGRSMDRDFIDLVSQLVSNQENEALKLLQEKLSQKTVDDINSCKRLDAFLGRRALFFDVIYLLDLIGSEWKLNFRDVTLAIACISICGKLNYDYFTPCLEEVVFPIIKNSPYKDYPIDRFSFNLRLSEMEVLGHIGYELPSFGITEIYSILKDNLMLAYYRECARTNKEFDPMVAPMINDFIIVAYICHARFTVCFKSIQYDFITCFKSSIFVAFAAIYSFNIQDYKPVKYQVVDFIKSYLIEDINFKNYISGPSQFVSIISTMLPLYKISSMTADHFCLPVERHYLFNAISNVSKIFVDMKTRSMDGVILAIEHEFRDQRRRWLEDIAVSEFAKKLEIVTIESDSSDSGSPKRQSESIKQAGKQKRTKVH
jgi:hypothetical protein